MITPNPAFHPTTYSGLRPLPASGEFERWAPSRPCIAGIAHTAKSRHAGCELIAACCNAFPLRVQQMRDKCGYFRSTPKIGTSPRNGQRSPLFQLQSAFQFLSGSGPTLRCRGSPASGLTLTLSVRPQNMRSLLLALLFAASAAVGAEEPKVSPLKLAFQQARAQRNIDLVLPVLKAATLYVVVGSEPQPGRKPEWFLTESPTKGRFCVTVSESEESLAKIRWPKVKLSGEQLLAVLQPGIEIVIVYADGGDYINREQLAWYRESK